MREINDLRRNMRDKPGKGGFELGKAGAFSQFLPDSTRLFPSLHNSITPYSIQIFNEQSANLVLQGAALLQRLHPITPFIEINCWIGNDAGLVLD